jgi:3,2-trans-enoyl-CoA isomerase
MLDSHDDGPIRTLRLNRPPVNALDAQLLARLEAAIAAAPQEGVRGIILTGSGERFSAGLDVPQLLRLDRAGVAAFWRAFFACLRRLAASPIPVVAAINGHSPAGGAVLALYSDRRIMVRGDYRIGLNEVRVGIYPGPAIYRVLTDTVGARRAAELLSTGAMLDPQAALATGFVDELAASGELIARARLWLEAVLALPPRAYERTRALGRAGLVELMGGLSPADVEATTDSWFEPETQAVLRAIFAKPGTQDRGPVSAPT